MTAERLTALIPDIEKQPEAEQKPTSPPTGPPVPPTQTATEPTPESVPVASHSSLEDMVYVHGFSRIETMVPARPGILKICMKMAAKSAAWIERKKLRRINNEITVSAL